MAVDAESEREYQRQELVVVAQSTDTWSAASGDRTLADFFDKRNNMKAYGKISGVYGPKSQLWSNVTVGDKFRRYNMN